MFQHTAQRSFLNRWRINSNLYQFHKESRMVRPYQSANSIEGFGAENWQSQDMEQAFADVERVTGYTDHVGEITDPAKMKILARWLALHGVRTRRYRDESISRGRDYRPAVDLWEDAIPSGTTPYYINTILDLTLSNPVDPVTSGGDPFTNSYTSSGIPTVTRAGNYSETALYNVTVPSSTSGTVRWFEVFSPDADPNNKAYTFKQWTIDGSTSSNFSLSAPADGTATVVPFDIQFGVVNRDVLSMVWANSVSRGEGTIVYAGNTTGDMVNWKINVPSELQTATFTWTATDSQGGVITGPTGVGVSEWRIANNGNDGVNFSLTWKPDNYTIKCVINISGGASIPIQFAQKVGWRTEDYLVIGQIVTMHTYDNSGPSASESFNFRTALAEDALLVPPGAGAALVASPVPNSIMGFLELASWALVPHSLSIQGPLSYSGWVTEAHRFWMMQNALNGSIDTPPCPDDIPASALQGTIDDKQYRFFQHYQVRFALAQNGTIDQLTLHRIHDRTDLGTTKLAIAAGLLSPLINDPVKVWSLPADKNILYDDKKSTSADGSSHSCYASGRIGPEGQNDNWRLWGKDVPWIYSEIICNVAPDHSVSSSIKTSVDKTWHDSAGLTGATAFNNINIFSGGVLPDQLGALQVHYLTVHDSPLELEGNLKGFIDSVPLGTFPTPPPAPSVQ